MEKDEAIGNVKLGRVELADGSVMVYLSLIFPGKTHELALSASHARTLAAGLIEAANQVPSA